MTENKINLTAPISLIVLSSMFIHGIHADNAIKLLATKPNSVANHHSTHHLPKVTSEVHVDSNSHSSDTFNLRTQPPSARPEHDDDSEDNAKRRQIDEDARVPSALL